MTFSTSHKREQELSNTINFAGLVELDDDAFGRKERGGGGGGDGLWTQLQTASRGTKTVVFPRPSLARITVLHVSFSSACSSSATFFLLEIFCTCVSSSFSPPASLISRSSMARIFFCRARIRFW